MHRFSPIIFAVVFALLMVGVGAALGAPVVISLSVDQDSVTVGQTISVSVSVSGGLKRLPDANLPDVDQFRQVGRSSMRNVSIVNTQMTVEKSTVFNLLAVRPGRAVIGPATVRVGRSTYQSNTETVNVINAKAVAPPTNSSAPSAVQGDPIFIRAEIDTDKPYQGSQATLSLYLYTQVRVSSVNFTSIPDFKNFWVEELHTPNRLTFTQVNVGGIEYQASLIRRYALFPLEAGDTTIDPYAVQAEIIPDRSRRNSGSPFDDDIFESFFGRRRSVDLSSEPLSISVLPLPSQDRPQDFEGAVGRFRMTVSLDKTEVAAGDPVTLEMEVQGAGNFKTLPAPKVQIPSSINTYSQKSDQDISSTPDKITGRKSFSMILVPREAGEFDIGPMTLDYFDPTQKVYKHLSGGPLKITVTGNGLQAAQSVAPTVQREVMLAGRDIRYIRADAKVLKELAPPYYGGPVFLAVVCFWPPMLLGMFLFRRHRRLANADQNKVRRRRAGRISRTRLKKARALLGQDAASYYSELTGAIFGFVADKTGRSASGIVLSMLIVDLAQAGVSDPALSDLKALFAEADAVRYGGREVDIRKRREAMKMARSVLEGIDKSRLGKGGVK